MARKTFSEAHQDCGRAWDDLVEATGIEPFLDRVLRRLMRWLGN